MTGSTDNYGSIRLNCLEVEKLTRQQLKSRRGEKVFFDTSPGNQKEASSIQKEGARAERGE